MNYKETIRYLGSFVNYERKIRYPYKQSFKLERIKEFLALLGDPQDSFKSIHVAGTKGKGSVCVFAAHILKEAGFKTGLYTSPHLSDCRERIRILSNKPEQGEKGRETGLEGMISKARLTKLVNGLKPLIEKFCRESKYGPLSFFEVYTVLAFVYFKQEKVDFAVLETGLGGRLDATNVVNPEASAITSISYDHMNKLGDTLTEIAREKSGIIKNRGVVVISAPQDKEAARVIRKKCAAQKALLYEIGKDILLEKVDSKEGYQEFYLRGKLGCLDKLRIRLLGKHQLVNAAAACGLVLALNKSLKAEIRPSAIRKGLADTRWPGRFEIISKSPSIVLDGAHNFASAQVLKETVKDIFKNKEIILVLGISRDKDIKGICRQLLPVTKKLILTRADNLRAAKPDDILAQSGCGFFRRDISLTYNVKEALKLALKDAKGKDLILVCGSIFVVGEARQFLC
ncbi:MAG: bifunctional folylpolyglutamate synthase/dihydrofolate synthase [Candidatus Omnitrophica bacterium]|nr:bifunctional folylpolyglutamate synthase/dihydrofolate synthase [Candidatus Omnitrophota bacterium]